MKRLFTTALLCIAVTPGVFADPPARTMAEILGYKSPELLEQLPPRHDPRAPRDPWLNSHRDLLRARQIDQDSLMNPRMYGRPEPADMIPLLVDLHRKQPESAKITRKLALTCLGAGQPREALYWFTQTFHRDRTDFPALWNMATLSYRFGDHEASQSFFREYASIDPHSAWGMMAREFSKSGSFSGVNLADGFDGTIKPKIEIVPPPSGAAVEKLMIIRSAPEAEKPITRFQTGTEPLPKSVPTEAPPRPPVSTPAGDGSSLSGAAIAPTAAPVLPAESIPAGLTASAAPLIGETR